MTQHYRCQLCRHTWTQPASQVVCPVDGHSYVEWLSFAEFFRSPKRSAEYRWMRVTK